MPRPGPPAPTPPGRRRSSSRTRDTSIPARLRRERTRGSSPADRASAGSFCSGRCTGCRSAAWRCPLPTASLTPLGAVAVDAEAVAQLRKLPQVRESEAAHSLEHSLEVQLPFLQTVLEAIHARTARGRRRVAQRSRGSHRAAVGRARDADRGQLRLVALPSVRASDRDRSLPPPTRFLRSPTRSITSRHAAPRRSTASRSARAGTASSRSCIDLRNSGDTAGEKSRVVGYAAFAFARNRTGERGDEASRGDRRCMTPSSAVRW